MFSSIARKNRILVLAVAEVVQKSDSLDHLTEYLFKGKHRPMGWKWASREGDGMFDNDAASDEGDDVKVPRRHVMAVYGFLANLDGRDRAEIDPAQAQTEVNEIRWPVEDLRRFAKTPTTTSNTIGRVLDEPADHPDEWVSTTALEASPESPGITSRARSLHSRATFGPTTARAAGCWPTGGGPALGPGLPAEVHYTLSTEQAERWKEARAAA